MDYYQGVVVEYLRADRAVFVNTECCIQLNEADNPDGSGPHWYADAVACDFGSRTVFLCEVTFSLSLAALLKRLCGWNANWDALKAALVRDSKLPSDWDVRPWLFIPEQLIPLLVQKLQILDPQPIRFTPRITPLEMVQPWRYRSWRRVGEAEKPNTIPPEMCA
jgi:hypothetical protein